MNRKKFIQGSTMFLLGAAGLEASQQNPVVGTSLKFEQISGKESVEQKFKWAKNNGFDSIEINSAGYRPGEIRAASVQNDLKVETVYCSESWVKSISSTDGNERKSALKSVIKAIELAGYYEASSVQVLPGVCLNEQSSKIQSLLINSLDRIAEILDQRKVKLLLQNFLGFYSDPSFFEPVMPGLDPGRFGFCVDSAFFSSQKDFQYFYESLERYTSKLDVDFTCLESLKLPNSGNLKLNTVSLDISTFIRRKCVRFTNWSV